MPSFNDDLTIPVLASSNLSNDKKQTFVPFSAAHWEVMELMEQLFGDVTRSDLSFSVFFSMRKEGGQHLPSHGGKARWLRLDGHQLLGGLVDLQNQGLNEVVWF